MNVYLAGKIYDDDWRFLFVSKLNNLEPAQYDTPGLILEKAVLNKYNYTGPFFKRILSKEKGRHGVVLPSNNEWGNMLVYSKILATCYEGIKLCDIFFAWINDDILEAYGTLNEIGFALGAGKQVVLLVDNTVKHLTIKEVWFSLTEYNNSQILYCRTPGEGISTYLNSIS